MAVNGATQAVIEGATNPQLSSKEPSPKSISESSTPDPWTDKSEPEPEPELESKSQLSMREILAARGVKGFAKAMPKVSQAEVKAEERKQKKSKTNIATMSLAEINEYLTDPILRAQLTPQLFKSDYELITDYLGQIIGVKAPPPAEE